MGTNWKTRILVYRPISKLDIKTNTTNILFSMMRTTILKVQSRPKFTIFSIFWFIDLLVYWFVDWWIDVIIGELIYWLVNWFIDWWIDLLIDGLIDRLVYWFFDRLIDPGNPFVYRILGEIVEENMLKKIINKKIK